MRPKITITKVDNGYIVRVINHGLGPLKEPYPDYKEHTVYYSLQDMVCYLKEFFDRTEE